jgi:hypothetical protein
MSQVVAEKQYNGKIVVGKRDFPYVFDFAVPMSQLDDELERREKLGEDVSSIEVIRQLFVVTLNGPQGDEADLSDDDAYRFLAQLLSEVAVQVDGCGGWQMILCKCLEMRELLHLWHTVMI